MASADQPQVPPATATVTPPGRTRSWWNWLTVLGLLLAGVAFAIGVLLLVVEAWQPNTTVYMSLLSLGVVPMLIGAGLAVAVFGVVLQLMLARRKGTHLTGLWFDLSRQRRWLPLWLTCIVIFLLVSAYGGYRSHHFVESKEFCGEVCHSVMHPEFTAHSNSPHSRVACVQCHVGPGIEHQFQAKMRGMHQVVAIAKGEFQSPLPTPLEHLRPASEICDQCHWPEKFIGNTIQDHVYFLPNEENTQHHLKLLMHVGGGTEDIENKEEDRPSIHWHVTSASKVSYQASDRQRQQIMVVKVTKPNGEVVTYQHEDLDEEKAALLQSQESRVMDCLDCHNRAVHIFKPPQRLLNQAMLVGAIDASLPYIKREGLRLLAAEYSTQEEALAKIAAELAKFYEAEYPEVWAQKRSVVEQAAKAMGDLYLQNFFPTMKADWRAHPDNIGHTFSQGCFRCHTDKMKTEQGESISTKCETCHDFVAQGTGKVAPKMLSIQEFIHPEDIDDLWQGSSCTDCHTGAGAE